MPLLSSLLQLFRQSRKKSGRQTRANRQIIESLEARSLLTTFAPSASLDGGGTVVEGNSATVTVNLSTPYFEDVDIDLAISDVTTNIADYSIPFPFTVTIPAGLTTGSILVPTVSDGLVEGTEQFQVEISELPLAISDASVPLDVFITDSAVDLTVNGATYVEGDDTVTGTVTRTGSTAGSLTVNLSAKSGTSAEAGVDFTLPATTATFAAGSSTASFSLYIVDDQLIEDTELFVIEASGGGDTAEGTFGITDNDEPNLIVESTSGLETDQTNVRTVFLRRTGGTTNVLSVEVETLTTNNYGTATAGVDFNSVPPTTVTFGSGEAVKPVNITILGDTDVEPDEYLTVRATYSTDRSAGNVTKTGTLTIENDDSIVPGTFTFQGATFNESQGSTLSTDSSGWVDISISRAGGMGAIDVPIIVGQNAASPMATDNVDFDLVDTIVTFTGNGPKTFRVWINDDAHAEDQEYFTLILDVEGGFSRQFSIIDNDATQPPTVSGSSSVTFSHCNQTGNLTIPLTVNDPDGNSSQVVITARDDSSYPLLLPTDTYSISGQSVVVERAKIDELESGTYYIPLRATDEDNDTGDGYATLTITNTIATPDVPAVTITDGNVHYLTGTETSVDIAIQWTDTADEFAWAIYALSANGDGVLDSSDWAAPDMTGTFSGTFTGAGAPQITKDLGPGIYAFTVDATDCGRTSDEAVEYFTVMNIGFETAENTENQCSSCASHRPGEEPVPGVKATSLDGNLIVDVAGSVMDIGGRLADFARVTMLSALNPHPVAYARVQLPVDVDADLTMSAVGDTSGAGGSARTSTTERDTTDTGGPVSILAPVQWGSSSGVYGLSSKDINIDTTLRIPGLPGEAAEVSITGTGDEVPADAPSRDLSDSAYGRRMDVAGISYLDTSDTNNPVLYRGNGTNLVYSDSQGTFQSPDGSFTSLAVDPGNGHIVTTDIGMKYYYDTSGRLYKTLSRAGDEVLIQYSTIDQNGDTLFNEVQTVTDSSTGATITYGYVSGQLNTITHSLDPATTNDDRTWTYQFTTSNLLESITSPSDPDNPTKPRAVVELTYHTDGTHLLKSIEQSDTSNGYYGRTEFTYDEWRNIETVTQVGDLATTTDDRVWTFDSAESRLLSGRDSWELPAANEDVTTGPEDRITMPNGDTVIREVDRFGKPVRETRSFSNYATSTSVTSDSSVTIYERNADGQVEKMIGPYLTSDGAVGADEQTYVYDAQRRLESITYPDGLSETWTYVGTLNGAERGPDQPDKFTNKLGQETVFTYASNGYASRETMYSGAVGTAVANDSSRVFNSDGLLQIQYLHYGYSGENAGDRPAVHYYYDSMERLIHVRETTWAEAYGTPNSATATDRWTSFGYDEYGYLAWTTTPYRAASFGTDNLPDHPSDTVTTDYDNDVMGNPVQTTLPDPDAVGTGESRPVYEYTYDPYSRQLTQVTPLRPGQTVADVTSTYTYNKFGETETVTTPVPGGPGSLLATVARNEYEYNSEGFLVSTTAETSAGTVVTSSHVQYNSLGLMLWQSDQYLGDVAAGSTQHVDRSRTQYDAEGRPTSIWLPGDSVADSGFNYNDATNTVTMTDPGGNAWVSVYDGLGRIISSTTPDPAGANGAITTTTWYVEGSTVYRREDNAAIHGTVVSSSVSSGGESYATTRQLIGVHGQLLMTESGDASGAGLSNTYTTYEYDQEGNLVTMDELSGATLAAAYSDTLRRTTEYEYNVRGQQIRTLSPLPSTGLSQLETNYLYDNLGRLTTEFSAKPEDSLDAQASGYSHGLYVETHYDYFPDGLLKRSEFFDKDSDTSNDTYEEFTYDNLGRTLTVTRPDATNTGTGVTSYEYNQLGLLYKETLPDPAGPRVSSVTTYQYDSRTSAANSPGVLLASVTAPAGNGMGTTAYEYDSYNQLESVYLPDPVSGNASSIASAKTVYDAFGRVEEEHVLKSGTAASYDVVTTLYDELGRVTHTGSIANAPAVTLADSYHEYQYDALGNLERVIDPIGAETLSEYDDWGRVTAVHQLTPGGVLNNGVSNFGTVTTTYDSLGRTKTSTRSATGMASETTTYEYDLFDRTTKIIHPSGYNEQFRYRQWGPLERHLNQYGQPTYFNHDSASRLISQENHFGRNRVEFEYNSFGQVETETRELTATTSADYEYVYDVLGLKTQDVLPTGGVVDYGYDTAGNLVSLTDATSVAAGGRNTTDWTYDRRNRVTSEQVNGTGPSKSWQYYENDTTQFYTDRNGDKREYSYQFAYGAGQQLTEEKWEVGGQDVGGRSYDYDTETGIYLADVKTYEAVGGVALGNVLTHVNFMYDSLGRMSTTRDYLVGDGDDSTWRAVDHIVAYDGFNRQDLSAFKFVETTSTASDLHRWDNSTFYQWDIYSRVSFVIQYLPQEAKATTTGENDAETLRGVNLLYFRNGDLRKITRSEHGKQAQVVSTYGLIDGGWIPGRFGSISHTATAHFDEANPVYSWTYEEGGRINTRTTPTGTIDYAYDALDQVSGDGQSTWTFDESGNRTGNTTTANNQLQNDGVYTYLYDNEGRRTRRTKTSTGDYEVYDWDIRGLLISITSYTSSQSGSNYSAKVEYEYDGLDRRIRRKVDENGNGTFDVQQRFVYGTNVLDPTYDEVAMVLDETASWDVTQPPGGEAFKPEVEQRLLNGPMLDQVFASEDATNGILWNLHDTQQSVTEVVEIGANDSSGNAGQSKIKNRITYTALGNHSETDPSFSPLQKYTGQIHDDIPLAATATSITGATAANADSEIVITAIGHGLSTGDTVVVSGVVGKTNANGSWFVTVIDADTFSLNGSVNGTTTYVANTGSVVAVFRLAYYDARWYDPSVNQFISEDPIGFAAGDPNLRRYVGNGNPNATDPNGLDEKSSDDDGLLYWLPQRVLGRAVNSLVDPVSQANRKVREVAHQARVNASNNISLGLDNVRQGGQAIQYALRQTAQIAVGDPGSSNVPADAALKAFYLQVLDTPGILISGASDIRGNAYELHRNGVRYAAGSETFLIPYLHGAVNQATGLQHVGEAYAGYRIDEQGYGVKLEGDARLSHASQGFAMLGGTTLGLRSISGFRRGGGFTELCEPRASRRLRIEGDDVGVVRRAPPRAASINPRLIQRLKAFRRYRLKGGTMDMARWVKATQGNPAYGTGFKSGFADWSRRVGKPVHGNSLAATGPHDVYVLRNANTGELLHFGETGRGYLTRFTEHQRDYARLGIDIDVELLQTVEGKAAARAFESRYIDAYIRVFNQRPPFNPVNH